MFDGKKMVIGSRLNSLHRVEKLFAEYLRLHDYFGRGGNNIMKTLKKIKAGARKQTERRGQPE